MTSEELSTVAHKVVDAWEKQRVDGKHWVLIKADLVGVIAEALKRVAKREFDRGYQEGLRENLTIQALKEQP
jgi:hypothetical protein